ncbi:MAG: hypothetical protein ACM32J_05120 [Rhizobacter sp.]|jgi:hypothetical protein
MTTLPAATAEFSPDAQAARPSWRSRFTALAQRALGRPAEPAHPVAAPAAPHPGPATVKVPRAPAVAPAMRSVPVPLAALTQALDRHPMARSRMRHLALVESSCILNPADPFAKLPPRAMDVALRQLDVVLTRHPELHVLRLQLERQLQAHRTRIKAALAAEDRRWRPEAGDSLFFESTFATDSQLGGPWGSTGFMETLPLERASDRGRGG